MSAAKKITIRGVTYASQSEAAERLGVSDHAVYVAKKRGRLEFLGIGKGGLKATLARLQARVDELEAAAINMHPAPDVSELDEEFDTMMEVQRNPYGAWQAIQTLAAKNPAPELIDIPHGLIDALLSGEQADMDGCRVKVSREACERAASILAALAKLKGGDA